MAEEDPINEQGVHLVLIALLAELIIRERWLTSCIASHK